MPLRLISHIISPHLSTLRINLLQLLIIIRTTINHVPLFQGLLILILADHYVSHLQTPSSLPDVFKFSTTVSSIVNDPEDDAPSPTKVSTEELSIHMNDIVYTSPISGTQIEQGHYSWVKYRICLYLILTVPPSSCNSWISCNFHCYPVILATSSFLCGYFTNSR